MSLRFAGRSVRPPCLRGRAASNQHPDANALTAHSFNLPHRVRLGRRALLAGTQSEAVGAVARAVSHRQVLERHGCRAGPSTSSLRNQLTGLCQPASLLARPRWLLARGDESDGAQSDDRQVARPRRRHRSHRSGAACATHAVASHRMFCVLTQEMVAASR